MNTFSADLIDTLANLTEEEFHSEPDRLLKELNRMTNILETVHELFLLEKSTLFHIDEVAEFFEEDPAHIQTVITSNSKLLTLDGMTDDYLSLHAVFRLATLLPQNPVAQECISQLLDTALR